MSVSPKTPVYPRPRPGNPRDVAEKTEAATGRRVQIVGGKLVMSPTPPGKHAGVVRRLRRQLDRVMADWYAVAGVAFLPVVDPRKGTWALHTRPDNGAYQDVLPGKFGESVRLPEPLAIEIDTDGFPIHDVSPRGPRAQKGPFTEISK